MRSRPVLMLLSLVALGFAAGSRATAATPPAPTPLAPANGASVLVPFTISWSAVSDPSGIIAYNWQVSPSSSFTPVIVQNSTSGQTQDTVSGLGNGTYFWRVQAVNGGFVQGAWSQAQSFTVTGAGSGAPGTPTLEPPKGYSTFHPMEVMTFTWTPVSGAASYVFQASTDPSFPVLTRFEINNIPGTTYSFAIGDSDEGNYSARVVAIDANGVASTPSNVIRFSVFFNNPLPPPPSPVSPANGTTVTLPITLTWTDVPNPQPSGYELQIAKDSGFSTIEEDDPQLNGPSRTVLSLTPGPKFWRVRSFQGDSSPTTAAVTAWSAAGSFVVPTAPPRPVSVTLATNPLYSGASTWVAVQLSAAVSASGATINLTSSNSAAAPVPATITMPGNTAWTQFQLQAGQVTAPSPVTLTATLNSGSASVQFNVLPAALKSLSISPSTITGGVRPGGIVMLNGQAPPGGAVVSLSSNSPAVSPPSTVTVAPGDFSVSFPIATSAVTTNTTATVTAAWNGLSTQAQVTLTPQQPPTSLTLNPTSTVGAGGSSFGTVTVASPPSADLILPVTSSNPAVASVPGSVTIPAGSTTGGFNIFTTSVSVQTAVTISVSGGGVTRSSTLTVNPQASSSPALASLTVSPTSLVGGNTSKGTVTLSGAAPSGGAAVALSSSNTNVAAVPTSVTVAAGSSTATFPVTTKGVSATTAVTLSAVYNSLTRTATLTVNPASTSALAAPTLLSPAADARFAPGAAITFDWSDVNGAASYTIQIATSDTFTAPLTVNQNVAASQFTSSTLPVARMWWRARANDTAGKPGSWSSIRRFEVKN
jgi:hypothetical protein